MRHFLIPVLLLGLIAGCSGVKVGPHRIDVQQGNALDQENVARLKPGLSRSQVRFLLGTPLLVDPFRNDRWDYVYVYYKAGKLAEQKRITLFFEGDTLARIEGDLPEPVAPAPTPAPLPAPAPAVVPDAKAEAATSTAAIEITPMPVSPAPQVAPIMEASPRPEPVVAAIPLPAPIPVVTPVPAVVAAVTPARSSAQAAAPATSIVAPLPGPQDAPAYVDRRPVPELSLQPETDVAKIQPDVMPSFPEADSGTAKTGPEVAPSSPVVDSAPAGQDAAVLKSLAAWVDAWGRRDEDAYFSAYDASFIPQGGVDRADWEKGRRLLLGLTKNLDIRIETPLVERKPDGMAEVTFNQFYRSDNYSDAVIKLLRLTENAGRWLIVEERVLAVLRRTQP